MTIVFNLGGEFWIEQLNVTVQIPDAAGETNSVGINLVKPGNCVGFTAMSTNPPNNDNSQAVAIISLETGGGASISSGLFITSVRATITKFAGTAGLTNIPVNITLLMRGTGPIKV